MTATLAGSAAILKTLYAKGVPQEIIKRNNGFILLEKKTDFYGQDFKLPVQTETTQGGSATYATAVTSLAQSVYYNFLVTRIKDYSLASIDGEAMEAANGDSGSMVALWKNEMDSAFTAATRQAAIMMYRSGSGQRGRITSTSTIASATISIRQEFSVDVAGGGDIQNFAQGMKVQGTASANENGALLNAGAQETIAGLSIASGTLTSTSANWNTVIAALAVSDYLSRSGDGINNTGIPKVLTGFKGWLPGGAAPGTLFGLNRTPSATALAGTNYNATTVPYDIAMIEGIYRLKELGGGPDTAIMHPRMIGNLMKVLDTKSRYPKTSKIGTGVVSFEAVEFATEDGGVKIIPDMNCQMYTAWLFEEKNAYFKAIGSIPKIFDFDNNKFLREASSDAYTVRCGMYGQFIVEKPKFGAQISNYGN
jgi:hypothetical protein